MAPEVDASSVTPPAFGADGRAILREAGFKDGEVSALVAEGVVVEKPRKM